MVVSGVVLMAGASCTCVKIYNGCPPCAGPYMQQGSSQPSPPSGGDFVPVQATLATGGSISVCGQAVSGTYVRFYPPTQTAPTGYTGFRGYLVNVNTGATIANTDYELQWFYTAAQGQNGCCANVGGSSTDVSCLVTAGWVYRFTAHFFTGHVPTGNPAIRLNGAWTP